MDPRLTRDARKELVHWTLRHFKPIMFPKALGPWSRYGAVLDRQGTLPMLALIYPTTPTQGNGGPMERTARDPCSAHARSNRTGKVESATKMKKQKDQEGLAT